MVVLKGSLDISFGVNKEQVGFEVVSMGGIDSDGTILHKFSIPRNRFFQIKATTYYAEVLLDKEP